MSVFNLQDRTALILGPASSFNRSIAISLARHGANVALLDENIKQTQTISQHLMDEREINEKYGKSFAVQVKFDDPASLKEGISKVTETFGTVDIYIDGTVQHKAPFQFSQKESLDRINSEIQHNLITPLTMTSLLIPYLKARKRGRIIYLIHDHARLGLPQNSLLAASRGGLLYFAKSLARELFEDRITVNCVSMGTTEEYLLDQSLGKENIDASKEKLKSMMSWAQVTDGEKIANAVCFLASPQAIGFTGQTLAANDGLSMF